MPTDKQNRLLSMGRDSTITRKVRPPRHLLPLRPRLLRPSSEQNQVNRAIMNPILQALHQHLTEAKLPCRQTGDYLIRLHQIVISVTKDQLHLSTFDHPIPNTTTYHQTFQLSDPDIFDQVVNKIKSIEQERNT